MVSLRRRRLMGISTAGVWSSFLPELTVDYSNTSSVPPIPFDDLNIHVENVNDQSKEIDASNVSESSHSYGQHNQPNTTILSKESDFQDSIEPEVKRRKQHRRRRIVNQEQNEKRGVYFKNNKWQAAIKVDKKQIHLGTFSLQADAAHLYDRAAFMCGRETNTELPEEEKTQLKKLKWDEFLAITRRAIISKRGRRV
ncbi:ethylene-responsive transcription factor-like protein At4g13040 [Amaranthus tricolor]|uniref:ethylene-responsive transcription factor-like protein At4g13040 n=1 Tax=Amaranthus tricolor TaxID=29722 RepID=UPI0025864D66|nr:ethylene-responsive transcription factor-like protein At4g13040 [Amaranthus tricolor]